MAGVVYHWRHGWIPLDHTAALSNAKGNHDRALRLLAAAKSHETGIKTPEHLAHAKTDLPNLPAQHQAAAQSQIKTAEAKFGNLPSGVTVTEHHSGRLHVQTPYDKQFVSDVKNLGGTWSSTSKTWSVPGKHADKLQALIDRTYGEKAISDAPSLASLPSSVSITTRSNGDIAVKGPYNNDFRLAAKGMARWDGKEKAWVFPPHRKNDAERLAAQHYGSPGKSNPDGPGAGRIDYGPKFSPQKRSGKASPKQVDYAMSLLDRLGPSGWHDTDSGQYGPMPRRADLESWDSRDVSDLISELRDEWR